MRTPAPSITDHDNYSAEAAFYDQITAKLTDSDLPFYQSMARQSGGPVLEFACGTGRLLIPVAAEVGRGVGVDRSPAMIEIARRRASQHSGEHAVVLKVGDIRDIDLGETFSLIQIPYSSLFQLPSAADLNAALSNIRRHLQGGGRVVADFFVPNIDAMRQRHNQMILAGEYRLVDQNARLLIWEYAQYSFAKQLVHRRRVYETVDTKGVSLERRHGNLTIYYRTPIQMMNAFADAGLRVIETYGDFSRGLFEPNSDHMILVAVSD